MSSPLISIHRLAKPEWGAARDRDRKPPRPTPDHPLIISASELRDWLRCRVKHHWRYQMRLIPRGGAPALAIGTLIHAILEAWYALPHAKRVPLAMTKIAKRITAGTRPEELTLKDMELIRAMTIGYAAWAKPRDEELGMRNCQPEDWFELPLLEDGSIRVRGKMDIVFQPHAYKRTMGLHEHKSKAQIRNDVTELNLQLSVYLWALRQKYPKFKRFIAYYNTLRKQMPGPRVRAELFDREAVERTDDEIDQWALDTQRAVHDMIGAAVYPSPMESCGWECDFRVPCLMRGRPWDLKHVLKHEYKRKEDR